MNGAEADPPQAQRPQTARMAGALALTAAVALAGAWFLRLQLAEALIKHALARAGEDAALEVEALDFGGAAIADLRLGPTKAPDFWAKTALITFDWSAGLPGVHGVTLRQGGVRLRFDQHRAPSSPFTGLRLKAKPGGGVELPDWDIDVSEFRLLGETPFGAFDAAVAARGRLRSSFHAEARLAPGDHRGTGGAAEKFRAALTVSTHDGRIAGALRVAAHAISWNTAGARPDAISNLNMEADFNAPTDLSAASITTMLRADRAAAAALFDAATPRLNAEIRLGAFTPTLRPGLASGELHLALGSSTIAGQKIEHLAVRAARSASGAIQFAARSGKALSIALDRGRIDAAGSATRLSGAVTLTAPIAGLQLVDARASLDLEIAGGAGTRIGPAHAACMPIGARRIEAPGVVFLDARALLCPIGPAYFTSDRRRLGGGFVIDRLDWTGRTSGGAPGRLRVARLEGDFSGDQTAPGLSITANGGAFISGAAHDDRLQVNADRTTTRIAFGQRWSLAGETHDVTVDAAALPGRLTHFGAHFSGAANPRGEAVFRIARGEGVLLGRAPAPLFNPVAVRGAEGELRKGRARASGDLALAATGAKLGVFTLRHDMQSGGGEAEAVARGLTFSAALQPYQISEIARGVIDAVRGPIDGELHARWNARSAITEAHVALDGISFATAALGPVEGVSGDVNFDDLAKMHSPPGQTLSMARINPGVPVENGRVRFQALDAHRIALEAAQWPFANGTLSVEPTILHLGAPETRLTLALKDVDVNTLTSQLNVRGLSATGTVHGRFPLVFTPTKGRIEHGRLEADAGGGKIAYQGDVGVKSGAGAIAFDALRSFDYEELWLDLDGDLDGELVSAVHFSGRNREPLRPSGAPIKAVGIPFKFTVTVHAPFVALARNAAGFSDASRYLRDVQIDPGAPSREAAAPVKK